MSSAPQPETVTLTIDGRAVEVPKGTGLVETAAFAGVEIPVFCYEPRLGPPVGACRMCLVEIEGVPKLQAACATGYPMGGTLTGKRSWRRAVSQQEVAAAAGEPLSSVAAMPSGCRTPSRRYSAKGVSVPPSKNRAVSNEASRNSIGAGDCRTHRRPRTCLVVRFRAAAPVAPVEAGPFRDVQCEACHGAAAMLHLGR